MGELQDSRFSRDLLQRFTCAGGENLFPAKQNGSSPENIELDLGLSLNGRFGVEVDPQRKLFRASSVNNFANFSVDVELSLYSPITRTCSLPPETEVEWRKRKELQSLRRSEAKRKRVEKLKNVRVGLKQSPPSSPAPAPAMSPAMQFSSQGSIGSQGSGGSSGISDLESQPFQGIKRKSESHDPLESNKVDRSHPKIKPAGGSWPEIQTMPCVSTKVEGPNGKKIQGFLYRYGKGEEVRIVCVCHGSFLTPAEFVKHGGGDDVEHPLKHIVVTPSLFS